MTLCVAAACQDRGKSRVIIGTDWKASIEIATAEIQDKLYWITDNIPVLVAGTITKAIDLKNTYRQFYEYLRTKNPPLKITHDNMADVLRKGAALQKRKVAEQYISSRFGMTYKMFRMAVGKGEIPQTVAIETYTSVSKLDLDCHLIIITFDEDNEPFIYRIDENGEVEHCEAFAAIGTGMTIAESVLYQRQHESDDPIGPSVYHVFEAMKLGSIASDVGEDHTIDILYPPGEKKKDVAGDYITEKTKRWLERQFKKYGPKEFTMMPLPKSPFERDF